MTEQDIISDAAWTETVAINRDWREYASTLTDPVSCPECGTPDWEFTGDGQPECVNGHIWNQVPEIPGTFVRPGYPGDMNDPERFPGDDEQELTT